MPPCPDAASTSRSASALVCVYESSPAVGMGVVSSAPRWSFPSYTTLIDI